MSRWTAVSIPDQHGRTVIVTGANSGLGAEATRVLAEAGAKVIMACRNPDKGKAVASVACSVRSCCWVSYGCGAGR
jgi:NAD(P)-dependent dehydrogenase (short-subunit alcohol dehydrogenase family)